MIFLFLPFGGGKWIPQKEEYFVMPFIFQPINVAHKWELDIYRPLPVTIEFNIRNVIPCMRKLTRYRNIHCNLEHYIIGQLFNDINITIFV